MEFEVGEIVIHCIDGRHGRLIDIRPTRAPLVEVRWKDLTTSVMPIDMIRKRGSEGPKERMHPKAGSWLTLMKWRKTVDGA